MHIWIIYVCVNFMGLKETTAVSHSSTEAEIVSLDARLRMEGIPALSLWDTMKDMLHPQAGGESKLVHQTQILKHQEPLGDIDYVPPSARCSACEHHHTSSKTTKLKSNK